MKTNILLCKESVDLKKIDVNIDENNYCSQVYFEDLKSIFIFTHLTHFSYKFNIHFSNQLNYKIYSFLLLIEKKNI